MGSINSIPVVSQTKSLVQVIAGDQPGALATQIEFSRQCPIVSQVNSAIQAAKGDMEEAKKIQEEDFMGAVENVVDAVPVVGHIKGAVHYALDQEAEGDKAMKSASRSTGAIVGGLVGSLGGPGGAVAGGILGATLTDGVTTAVDSAVHEKFCPNGIIQQASSLVNDDAKSTPGAAFDFVAQIGFDALSGYGAGNNFGSMEAPGLPFSKPPSVVGEPTKIQMRAVVYRKKAATDELFSFIDPFEVSTSKAFMHNMAGHYIREAVLNTIQKTFLEEIAVAKSRLEDAQKEGKDVEKAQAEMDKISKEKLRHEIRLMCKERYEVQIMCEDPNKQLAVPFQHLGWGEQFDAEVKYYAKFSTVRIAISIEPAKDNSDTHSVMMLYAYPLDGYNNIMTWKQVAIDSAHAGITHFYDIDLGQTVNVLQDAPISATFTDKTTNMTTKIEGNALHIKKKENGEWEKLDKFGLWVSDTCFVCDGKCYRKEDCEWVEERKEKEKEEKNEMKEEKSTAMEVEKEAKVEKEVEEKKDKVEGVYEKPSATAAM